MQIQHTVNSLLAATAYNDNNIIIAELMVTAKTNWGYKYGKIMRINSIQGSLPQKSDNTIPWLFHDNLNRFHDFSAARIANAVLESSSHIHHIYKDNCLVVASSSPYSHPIRPQ